MLPTVLGKFTQSDDDPYKKLSSCMTVWATNLISSPCKLQKASLHAMYEVLAALLPLHTAGR
jgi:hypothetical protein